MSGFHFPQYEHELFWRYYDRLHAYLTQCDSCGCLYGKWDILHVVDEGVNCETRALFEYWDFYAKSVDEAYDFLGWLAWDTYDFETSCSDSYIPPPCIPAYVPPVCDICHCSGHYSSSCPYYISDEGYAELRSMIDTIDKQRVELEIHMREFDLSHETDLKFSSPKLEFCLCDDGASFPPLESGLEAVLDPSLATLPLVAPSSPNTFRDDTTFNMLSPDPPLLPLAQSTEFEVGDPFTVKASVDEDDACYDADSVSVEVHDSVATLARISYVDVVITVPVSHDVVNDISHDTLDTFHASPLCSLPSSSLGCYNLPATDYHDVLKGKVSDCIESLGIFRGYDPSLDPYSLYLESMPLKIMFITAYTSFTDFSTAFDKFKRALTIILSVFLFKCFYLHSSEFHAKMFDKLLRALTASEFVAWILSLEGVADAPSASRSTILRGL